MARDRIRVQRWRRQQRLEQHQVSEAEQDDTTQVVLGHGPGQGCDFCDNLRLERADGLKEEEEDEEEWERAPIDDLDTIAETTFDAEEEEGKGMAADDSQTLRAMQEERIIDRYLKTASSSSSSSIYPPQRKSQKSKNVRRRDEEDEEERKRASQWARSYTRLVDTL